ncbi:Tex family protein [Candidatus Contubernalis alkaliaceticus]|uniref:Tex family protein n=1 Tax=Candidatus Contubernalis alkaliaceticus TaxID=338645 RepID=UPI00240A32CA|nr:Tex family protein [Candidatus Contubernalis alkalaceticus]
MEEIISRRIALALKLDQRHVLKVVALLDEGNTIPFIARYRKEVSGGMTDEDLRLLAEKLSFNRNLENRRADIHRFLEEQGVLTSELEKSIQNASNVTELEDIYRPFKPKKRTRATIAKEKGLEPLAQLILKGHRDLEDAARKFMDEEREVLTADAALAGARDIIAELISEEPKLRSLLRSLVFKEGEIVANVKDKETGPYEMYYNYREPCRKVQPHRILAMNRGEREKILNIKIQVPETKAFPMAQSFYGQNNGNAKLQLDEAIKDSWKRLLFPSLEREIRSELTQKAEEQAIRVFQENLRNLLMIPPVRGKRIMAMDPGLRTGCKIACVDEQGKLLETAVIFPIPPRNQKEKATRTVLALLEKHALNAIAIGNGTGGRETEMFVVELLEEYPQEVAYTVVNEAGASVYSASKLGQAEFPHLDVSERSAISLARRVQDAMAELVKIDPRSIGVGQYQHDVNQKKLNEVLAGVVESCVNRVGVDLNTASPALLEHVAGINKTVAENIVFYRENNGPFTSRKELKKVPKLGPAAFKQGAGFLRIPTAQNYLDRTAVHPESYDTAEKLMHQIGIGSEVLGQGGKIPEVQIPELAAVLQVGEPTLKDILEEFKKPGRDPRDDLPQPVFKKGILNMEDLKENMEIQGVIRNVVDFGAFVDIGVHVDGLVHISELCNRFVKHPLDVVKVGDIVNVRVLSVDTKKKRISLSMKEISSI